MNSNMEENEEVLSFAKRLKKLSVWLENGFQTTFDPKNRPGTYQAQLTCQGRTWYTFAIIVDQEE